MNADSTYYYPKDRLILFASEWRPYIYMQKGIKGQLEMWGPIADLLRSLANSERLNYTLIPMEQVGWGDCFDNGTCTGIFHRFMRKDGDIGTCPIVATDERFASTQITNSLFSTEMVHLLMVPDSSEADAFGFLSPLDSRVWMFVLVTITFLCIVLMIVNALGKLEDRQPISRYLWMLVEIMFLKGWSWPPSANPARMIFTGWSITVFVVMSAYGGVLTSTFFLTSVAPYVKSLQEFAEFPDVTPLILGDSGETEFFASHPNSPYKYVWDTIKSRKAFLNYDELYVNIGKLAGLIQSSKYALICLKSPITFLLCKEEFYSGCERQIYFISEPFASSAVVLPLRKDIHPEFLERLNYRILRMQQANLLENQISMAGRDFNRCLQKKSGPNLQAISIPNIFGVFVLWAGGSVTAVVVAIVEKITCLCKIGRKNLTNNNMKNTHAQRS